MRKRVAIVGSGPTALYALQELVLSRLPLEVTIFEASDIAGKGTPYQRGINDDAMLSNIPSVEIPHLPVPLVDWLKLRSDEYLASFEIKRRSISDRAFYPRVVLGDYFRDQFETVVARGRQARQVIEVRERTNVIDVVNAENMFTVQLVASPGKDVFDHVVLATGHSFPSEPETSPGYFDAPWPATALRSVPSGSVGILGTSLSAIDAVMALATSFGQFVRCEDDSLEYRISEAHEEFQVSMMSRKGLLPEADFYFPIPYKNPLICTAQAVSARLALGSSGLLDDVFDLFRQELEQADPEYSRLIAIETLTVDTFAAAYYGVRDNANPFEWAASNLAEAKRNYEARHTIAWRYAILVTHEIVESAVSCFTADDLVRFNRSFKSIFADDYATVPHLSIERLLALHRAKRLNIIALGDQSEVRRNDLSRGATIRFEGGTSQFDTFIDATGQRNLSADDLPFPTLKSRGLISPALTTTQRGNPRRTGGVSVDKKCRPLISGVKPVRGLYFPAVSYLLHKKPFVQGITSAAELGQIVARSIIEDVMQRSRSRLASRSPKRRRHRVLESA